MADMHDAVDGATPLDPDEMEGLIPTFVNTRDQLNELEQINILEAEGWAFSRGHVDILTEKFIKELHRKMFGDVWRWAGEYRRSDKNIGVPHYEISVGISALLDDVRFWIENETYPPDEIAVRLHHRLVQVHPFPNGNGRLTRMVADLMVVALGGERFSWGGESLETTGQIRRKYISALRIADDHDIEPLLDFARS